MRTVRQLAKAAGVSVRTLHHYDAIGLLRPAHVGDNGYRYYGKPELLRLQQILFYRELDFPLAEIAAVLDDPGFDPVQALRGHRQALERRIDRYRDLIATIDRTIVSLEKDEEMEDNDLYAGIAPETRQRWEREAEHRWGKGAIESSMANMKALSKDEVAQMKREMEEIRDEFARLFREGADPASDEVQDVTRRHVAWVSRSWTPNAETFRGLGRLYVENAEFRQTYKDDELPGCPEFISEAMAVYADRSL